MDCLPNNPATRRYRRRFSAAMILYVVALFGAVLTFRHLRPGGLAALVIAVLPALPIIGVIVTAGLYLGEETDEFQRSLFIEAMMWALGGTLAFTTVWGFLENFLGIAHLQPYLVFPLFAFLAGVSRGVLRLRYR
jgi:hypothetical protein